MIRKLIFLIITVAAIIFGISYYLNVDDLSACNEKIGAGTNCQAVDAIVAISGGDTAARTNEAINLYKNGWSNKLIFSGAAIDKTGPSNAEVMKQLAITAGVPADDIYIDEYAGSTKQNAQNTQAIFLKIGAKKIILVTSGYHQRRASLEFKKYSSDITVLNHSAQNDSDWTQLWFLTPRGWWLVANEISKIVVFHIFGV